MVRGHWLTLGGVRQMSPQSKCKKVVGVDKVVDFGRQLFAVIIRSRAGSLSEMARLLRFQPGTKSFHRQFERLMVFLDKSKQAFHDVVLKLFPDAGFRLGIVDDSSLPKSGKGFPKQQIHHEHSNNTFYSGMKVLSTSVYQAGKLATISSQIVGKTDNKLSVAEEDIDVLVKDYLVDIILFDSWYCKNRVLEKIQEHNKIFISRLRIDSKVNLDEKTSMRLDHLAKNISHKQYQKVKIKGKSYWIYDMILGFESYGNLRVIVSKEGQHEKPIFLTTNAEKFSAKFIVKLYLRRFTIEVFFKDAKQYLNLNTFMCRPQQKWDLHLHLTNVLHWAIQKKNSISKTVRTIRENIQDCLLFINQNQLINKFFDELKKRCQT